MKCKTLSLVVLMIMAVAFMFTHQTEAQSEKPDSEKLVVISSSADGEVALNMVSMYTSNSKPFGWWDDIPLIVWGPSAKLLAEDEMLQIDIKNMIDAGIVVKACKVCSDGYDVSHNLKKLGIIVKYMQELTDYMKEG